MKKLLLIVSMIFAIFISGVQVAQAKKTPVYKNSIQVEGIGIIKLPQEFSVYESPDFNSKVIKTFKWGESLGAYVNDDTDGYVVYYPTQNAAYMTVTDDLETGGWYEVCYDQKNKLKGWVSPSKYEVWYWLSFFTKFGKANGLYEFRDLDLTEKRLYSKPDFDSQIIGTFEKSKSIRVHIFRGNWVLVRVYDFEGGMKIGWLKWRTNEGKFIVFPNVIK